MESVSKQPTFIILSLTLWPHEYFLRNKYVRKNIAFWSEKLRALRTSQGLGHCVVFLDEIHKTRNVCWQLV